MKILKLTTAIVFVLSFFNVNAQSLFTPSGTVGNSGTTSIYTTPSTSLGIGTTTPAATLHLVSANANATPILQATAGTANNDFFKIWNGTTNTTTFYPCLWGQNGFNNSGYVLPALGLIGSTTNLADVISPNALITLTGRQYNSGVYSPILNRKLFQITNLSTPVFTIEANGNISSSGSINASGNSFLNGKLAIGITNTALPTTSTHKLYVGGSIICEELVVKLQANWPDYVFTSNYKLMPLSQVKKYIAANNHLPDVPAACEIEENGVATGEMLNIQMKKIEELTLYLIQMEERIKEMELQNKALQNANGQ